MVMFCYVRAPLISLFVRRKMSSRQEQVRSPLVFGLNEKERVEQYIRYKKKKENKRLKALKMNRRSSDVMVHTLMLSSSMVISLNSRDFSLLIAKTMRELYAEETRVRMLPKDLARCKYINMNSEEEATTYEDAIMGTDFFFLDF